MSSGIIDTIKKVALKAFEASNPVQVLFGKVTSTDPLTVQVGERLTLTKEFLVVNGEVFKDDTVSMIRCQGGQKYVVLGTRTGYVENTIYVGGGVDSNVIDKAVTWAIGIANDNSHRYSQSVRWGPHYDCSSLVITAYEKAGVPVKSKGGGTFTGNMYKAFTSCGFKDVTTKVNLITGAGMKKGDVLLNTTHHAAMVQQDGGKIVQATDWSRGIQSGLTYFNYPWNHVLRYVG